MNSTFDSLSPQVAPEESHSPEPNRMALPLIGLILILAALLRLPMLDSIPPGLWYDEALDGQDAWGAWQPGGGLRLVYPDVFPRETLYTSTLAIVTRIAGPHVVALRMVSVAIGLFTILLTFGWLKRELGIGPALAASAVLASLRWHVIFSRLIFRTITLGPWLVGLTWAGLAWRRDPRKTTAFVFGLMLGGGFHTYLAWYFMLPYAGGLAAWLAWKAWRTRDGMGNAALRSHLAYAACGFLLLFLPLAIHYLRYPQDLLARPQAVSVFSGGLSAGLREIGKNALDAALMLHWRGDHVPKHNIPWKPLLDPLQGIGLLAGLWACIAGWLRRGPLATNPLRILLPLWVGSAMLATIFTHTDSPNSLRTLCMTPAVAALVGIGYWQGARMLCARGKRPLALGALVALVLASGGLTARDVYQNWARRADVWQGFNGDIAQLGRFAATAPAEVAVYVPQFLWQHRTFQYLTINHGNIYPYSDFRFLSPWPTPPLAARPEAPAHVARDEHGPSGRQAPPRERWIIVTANNRIYAPLMQLVPDGRDLKQFKAPAGNTWALAWAVPERALPSPAAVAELQKNWRGELRF